MNSCSTPADLLKLNIVATTEQHCRLLIGTEIFRNAWRDGSWKESIIFVSSICLSAFVVELLLQASSQLKRIFLEQAQNKLALILRWFILTQSSLTLFQRASKR